ncbi:hypothetical protein GQ457_15G015230 [Hibiscus cannabinus]
MWKASGFNYCPSPIGFLGFCQWWFKLGSLDAKGNFRDGLNLISFICWHLWKARKASGFNYCPSPIGFLGLCQWWFKLGSLDAKGNFRDGLNLISFICWHLWKARNAFTFSSTLLDPIEVWLKAEVSSHEFSLANHKEKGHHVKASPSNRQWTPPPSGFIKINCDASIEVGTSSTSAAAILRDYDGTIVGGVSC